MHFSKQTAALRALPIIITMIFSASAAYANDPFTEIPAGETTLKMVYDHGDNYKFTISGEDNESATDGLSEKITKLYSLKPTLRGDTRAWDIDYKNGKASHAKKVSVLITPNPDGTYSLHMDRRKGGERNNSQKKTKSQASKSRARTSAAPARRALPPRPTPPPALVD